MSRLGAVAARAQFRRRPRGRAWPIIGLSTQPTEANPEAKSVTAWRRRSTQRRNLGAAGGGQVRNAL